MNAGVLFSMSFKIINHLANTRKVVLFPEQDKFNFRGQHYFQTLNLNVLKLLSIFIFSSFWGLAYKKDIKPEQFLQEEIATESGGAEFN
jgi:hypothetical protein